MALPTAPTAHSIVTEALERANALKLYSRAREQWLEEIKREIADLKEWKFLEKYALITISTEIREFTMPTDFKQFRKVTLYFGSHYGTATAGGAATLTLPGSDTITEDEAEGAMIFLTGGASSGDRRFITDYNASTRVVTPDSAWTATTGATTQYVIPDQSRELDYVPYDMVPQLSIEGTPRTFSMFNQMMITDKVPFATGYRFVIFVQYLVDISKVDLTDTRLTELYREWRNALSWGVTTRAYLELNDARYTEAKEHFNKAVATIMKADERRRIRKVPVAFRTVGGMPTGRR